MPTRDFYEVSGCRWAIVTKRGDIVAIGHTKSKAITSLIGIRSHWGYVERERERNRIWAYWKREHGARIIRVSHIVCFDPLPMEEEG